MDTPELAHIIEAILFVAGEPVEINELCRALEESPDAVRAAVDALDSDYSYHRRGICLKRFGSHLQLSTRSEYAPYVERLLQPIQRQPLSQAVLETLSVIAYRQPATKGDVEAVRGVKCDYSVQTLLNRGFIEECGRRETLGRPILYRTTDKFLQHFGIETLDELPSVDFTSDEGEITT